MIRVETSRFGTSVSNYRGLLVAVAGRENYLSHCNNVKIGFILSTTQNNMKNIDSCFWNLTNLVDARVYFPRLRKTSRTTADIRAQRLEFNTATLRNLERRNFYVGTPNIRDKAASLSEEKECVNSIRKEVCFLKIKNVWQLVRLPKNHNTIPGKVTYGIVLKEDKKNERSIAQLLGKGFVQTQGAEFGKAFSFV